MAGWRRNDTRGETVIRLCVFDAYGTLFDVAAAARRVAQEPEGEKLRAHWEQISADWRLKQLEYSWLRAVTGHYVSFWQVTCDGLDWALDRAGLADDEKLRTRLLALYRELGTYEEVPSMLNGLKNRHIDCAILSNGSMDMLNSAVSSAGLGPYFQAVLSVDEVRIFKPARAVYDLVKARFDVSPEEVLFVSSNGWDAAGASAYGFRAVWVNRTGAPVDRLMARPPHILPDLTSIAELT